MRQYTFKLDIETHGEANPSMEQVEALLDLHFQDLCYDDEFLDILGAETAISIKVTRMN